MTEENKNAEADHAASRADQTHKLSEEARGLGPLQAGRIRLGAVELRSYFFVSAEVHGSETLFEQETARLSPPDRAEAERGCDSPDQRQRLPRPSASALLRPQALQTRRLRSRFFSFVPRFVVHAPPFSNCRSVRQRDS